MSYRVIKADLNSYSHRNAIQEIWRNNLSYIADKRFSWLYDQNSCCRVHTWLALYEGEDKVVGNASAYERGLYVNGENFKIGIAIDFAVEKKHRYLGPAIQLQRAVTVNAGSDDMKIVLGFPNKSASGAFQRAGYKLLGEVELWTKLLKAESKIARYVRVGFLAKLMGLFLDSMSMLIDIENRIISSCWFRTDILRIADGRFDLLWEQAKLGFNITGVRSSSYLNWRYAECDTEAYRFFCLFEKQDRNKKYLKGYVVYSIRDNIATIWDLFTVNDKTILCLLSQFSEYARKEKTHSILLSFLGKNYFTQIFKKANFFRKTAGRSCLIGLDNIVSKKMRQLAMDKNNWFLFEGDMDL